MDPDRILDYDNWMKKHANRLANRYGVAYDDVYQDLALELINCDGTRFALLRVASCMSKEWHARPCGKCSHAPWTDELEILLIDFGMDGVL